MRKLIGAIEDFSGDWKKMLEYTKESEANVGRIFETLEGESKKAQQSLTSFVKAKPSAVNPIIQNEVLQTEFYDYDLYFAGDNNILDTFSYNYLPDHVADYGIGHDFRTGHEKLGFEFRMLDYCTVEEIQLALDFIYKLGVIMSHNEQLDVTAVNEFCSAYNNKIVNSMLIEVLKNGKDAICTKEYLTVIKRCLQLLPDESVISPSITAHRLFDEIYKKYMNLRR